MQLKRTLSVFVAVSMLTSIIPMSISNAAEEDDSGNSIARTVLPYQDTALSFEERAADLVSRMTLEEKVSQTGRSAPAISRLGVHKYEYWSEGLHGVARQGTATSFPTSLSMSNTWDRALMRSVMDITGTEARGKNNRYNLSYWNPTINMARDPRWGRNEESYGEDPYLTSELGEAAVNGMQGDDEKYIKVISTLKHYAANNCEGERQSGTSVLNESTLRDYYTKAFGNVIEAADPQSVMSSYNAISMYRNGQLETDYIASSANKYILIDVLRRTYGFSGYIVGDCGAWENLFGTQSLKTKLFPDVVPDNITAAMAVSTAYNAGNNLDCGGRAQSSGAASVKEGWTDEGTLDRAVYELFLARMKTGEFDDNAKYQDIDASVLETDEHVAVAEKAAEESLVLLENKNNTLPLKSDTERVAVVGSMANKLVLGDYTGSPTKNITPIDGIKTELKKLNSNIEVQYLGEITDDELLFNVNSIKLVKKNGSKTAIDLSAAESVSGMKLAEGKFINITPKAKAVVKNVNFADVASVEVEMATGSRIGGSLTIAYGEGGPAVAAVNTTATDDTDTYTVCTGEYTGEDGGYNGTADMYISASAKIQDFSVEAYKNQLDAADYIIAYAATIPKQDGLGSADASESHDRASIDLPAHEAHVQAIANAYPDKTIIVMSTVGQINVEPFKDKCAAMLWTSYNGQTQGSALGKVLTGEVNPSGHLTTTWYTSSDLAKMPLGSARQSDNGIYRNYTDYEINQHGEVPGRTYQYYSGTPIYPFGYGKSYTSFEYSNITVNRQGNEPVALSDTVDVNDTVIITADVANTGTVKGADVAQLYVTVPGADGVKLPLKQLKGFERLELNAGETKTVTFNLDMADNCFFDEETQKNYVPTGEYIISVGTDANTSLLTATLNVSGAIDETVKTVRAIPTGIKLYAAKKPDGTILPANTISADASIVLKNEKLIMADDYEDETYTSSNPAVAVVDADGNVRSGGTVGTAIITVEADGVSDKFAVVTEEVNAADDNDKVSYLEELEKTYKTYPEDAYTSENYILLTSIYNTAKADIENELLADNLPGILEEAVEKLKAVERISLTDKYVISSSDINYGVLEKETTTLTIKDGENDVETDGLTWVIDKLDASKRAAPTIAHNGELTVTENCTFKVTVYDYAGQATGSTVIYANIPVEGERADDGDGATLTDKKEGASGGLCAGNTGKSWMRFDGVKLSKLTSVKARVSKESGDSVINISLNNGKDFKGNALNPGSERIIASAAANATGAWTTWEDVELAVDRNEISKLNLDENGCGTLYVQTNGANLDYISFGYIDSDMDVLNMAGGKIKVSVPFANGCIVETRSRGEDVVVKTPVTEAGDYIFENFNGGDTVKYEFVTSENDTTAITAAVNNTYKAPTIKELTIFDFADPAFNSFFETSEGLKLSSGTGMNGIGGWGTQEKKRTVEYKGKTYTFNRGLKAGSGSKEKSNVYFVPEADGLVTALLDSNTERKLIIEQDGKTSEGYGTNTDILAKVEMHVEAGKPVYIYGGGSNKQFYGVIFDTDTNYVAPTPSPTLEPLPEIVKTEKIEAESYNKWWVNKANVNSGGNLIENTKNNDIIYLGEYDMSDLEGIDVVAGTKESGNEAEFFAVDTSGLNVSTAEKSAIEPLLTSDNSLGAVTIKNTGGWNTMASEENIVRVINKKTGTLGLFVKLTTKGSYCGNYDYFTLMYGAEASGTKMTYADGKVTITSDMKSANLIRARYDGDGVLISAKIIPVTITNGTASPDAEAQAGDKLMLWDSVDGMKPLCGRIDVPTDGTVTVSSGEAETMNE